MTNTSIEMTWVSWLPEIGLVGSVTTRPLEQGGLPTYAELTGVSQGPGEDLVLHYYQTTAFPDGDLERTGVPAEIREHLRARYESGEGGADPAGLLPDARFTVRTLRMLHQVVRRRALLKDTFRRDMLPFLVGTGEKTTDAFGRPAELFTLADREE